MTRKIALIAGDPTPVNRAVAFALATEGYDLRLAYRSGVEAARLLEDEIAALTGMRCESCQAALEEPTAAEQVLEQLGLEPGELRLLVWNAGLAEANRLIDTEPEQLDLMYRLNYRSAILFAQAAANRMITDGTPGSLLFLTSLHGIRAYAANSLAGSYAAALHRSAESLAMQLGAHRIRLNCIAPGITSRLADGHPEFADRIPLGLGTPEDIAQAAVFLGSDKARYITGITLKVDGGISLPGMPEYGLGQGWDSPMAAPGLSVNDAPSTAAPKL